MDLSIFLKHSDEVKSELLSLLDKKEDIPSYRFRSFCCSESHEGCDWTTASLIEYHCGVFYQSDIGEDEDSGVLVAKHKLYRVNRDFDFFQSLDVVSQTLAEMGGAITRVMGDGEKQTSDELFDDDCMISGGHPFVLDDFRVEKEFRGKGLGHLCLHLGLQAAGVEGNSLFIYPSKESEHFDEFKRETREHSDWEFLKSFYLSMDKGMKLIEEYNTIYASVYNSMNSVSRNREER